MTFLVFPREPGASGSIKTLRVLTAPIIRTAWLTSPGVQMVRSGGATQAPCCVLTTTTPRAA